MTDALIAELRQEGATTRRVLERLPDDKLTWKPHAKSMSLGGLALHVAEIPGALAEFFSELDREAPVVPLTQPASRAEVLAAFDKGMATAEARLRGWDERDLMAEWRMSRGGHQILAMPRIAALRSILFNHWYHHRGQLSVYLRLLDVPLPSIYGPTADENPFVDSATPRST